MKPNRVGVAVDEFVGGQSFEGFWPSNAFLFSVDEYYHELRLAPFFVAALGGGETFFRLSGHGSCSERALEKTEM